MVERLRGAELIVVGDQNGYLESTGGRGQDEDIAGVVATAGLEDIIAHFISQRRVFNSDWRTWVMVRQKRDVRSRTDYILGSDCRIFQNVAVRDLQRNYDH